MGFDWRESGEQEQDCHHLVDANMYIYIYYIVHYILQINIYEKCISAYTIYFSKDTVFMQINFAIFL
jgi:hypothetical protein